MRLLVTPVVQKPTANPEKRGVSHHHVPPTLRCVGPRQSDMEEELSVLPNCVGHRRHLLQSPGIALTYLVARTIPPTPTRNSFVWLVELLKPLNLVEVLRSDS